MKAIQFETELRSDRTLEIPAEVASELPERGKVTVVVCVDIDPEDAVWRKAAYEQFLRDDDDGIPFEE